MSLVWVCGACLEAGCARKGTLLILTLLLSSSLYLLPSLGAVLTRSSQPMTGATGARSSLDEEYLESIRMASVAPRLLALQASRGGEELSRGGKIHMMDARPYINAGVPPICLSCWPSYRVAGRNERGGLWEALYSLLSGLVPTVLKQHFLLCPFLPAMYTPYRCSGKRTSWPRL